MEKQYWLCQLMIMSNMLVMNTCFPVLFGVYLLPRVETACVCRVRQMSYSRVFTAFVPLLIF